MPSSSALLSPSELVASSTGRAAQPLRNNFICASPPVCTGGWQSSVDRDVGRVMLHFTVAEGTPDGSYPWSYTVDGTGGGNYSVTVQNGTVTFGQDWVILVTPSYLLGLQTYRSRNCNREASMFMCRRPRAPGSTRWMDITIVAVNMVARNTTTYTQVIDVLIGSGLRS